MVLALNQLLPDKYIINLNTGIFIHSTAITQYFNPTYFLLVINYTPPPPSPTYLYLPPSAQTLLPSTASTPNTANQPHSQP